MIKGGRAPVLALAILAALGSAACNEHADERVNSNVQNAAATDKKVKEMLPVEGVFTGRIRINGNNSSYDAILTLSHVLETRPADRPTETIEVPRLTATLVFPAVRNASEEELPTYHELMRAMGFWRSIVVDYGNYNATTQAITLPYTVPGYSQGSFGTISGEVVDGFFRGTWFAKPVGEVARFSLKRLE